MWNELFYYKQYENNYWIIETKTKSSVIIKGVSKIIIFLLWSAFRAYDHTSQEFLEPRNYDHITHEFLETKIFWLLKGCLYTFWPKHTLLPVTKSWKGLVLDRFCFYHRVHWPKEYKNHFFTTDPGAPVAHYQLIKVKFSNLCFSSSSSPIRMIFLPFDSEFNFWQ